MSPLAAISQGCQAAVQADSRASASASSSQVGKSWSEWQGRETVMRSGFMGTSLAKAEIGKRKARRALLGVNTRPV